MKPLVVSDINPRYFTAGDRAVYLTGSHIWNNLHDGMGPGSAPDEPERFDYDGYLGFLTEHGHNFIRLWRWEQFKSQAAGGDYHLNMAPQPWPRTGPELAKDGKPKFDLEQFDPVFFDRLRDRVLAARDVGIYVAVMLFEGFGLHLTPSPDNVEGHPFHPDSNVNGVGISSIVDYQVLPLDPHVRELQEAYIRQVVDTVHDLPNVLYEVANESSGADGDRVVFPDGSTIETPIGDSTQWQYWVIDVVKRYEQEMGYDAHPIGMTMQYPVPDQTKVNDVLFDSPADWISPGFDDQQFTGRWYTDPPADDVRKVVIADTDHFAPGMGDALWAWKSFVRGQHPILMDFGIIDGVEPVGDGYHTFEAGRYAMGDTLRFSERIDLLRSTPRGDLSSTGYALANPGTEYLALQPDEGPFTLALEAGTYDVEWFSVTPRETVHADELTVPATAAIDFAAPFDATPAVLLLTSRAGANSH
ncbi:hypothetical protein HPO96_32345 [Kribbella sandramycini]|uniref:Cellulase (Glycosyl hydrolase family 5) n=1 Tax=Kribbella sandramycini TaxID=60450 RepID=A0A7Y4L7T7_9ACTN|nr:hypothetical protein [Kribbella sandramycini]MBB6565948.1 hypothetical protein [Kribbella sandramycini]NOL44952.1 hypothetical protein [Kribbella sandramycini]